MEALQSVGRSYPLELQAQGALTAEALLFLLGVLFGVLAVRWLQRRRGDDKLRGAPAVVQCKQPASVRQPSPVVDPEMARLGERAAAQDGPEIQARFLTQTGKGVGPLARASAPEADPFSTDLAEGELLTLHRPTHDPELDRSGNYPYSEAFKGRNINWEIRCHLRFKKQLENPLLFGIELEEYVPIAAGAKYAMGAAISALKTVVGKELHHSVGDDPRTCQGELERPVFVMPIRAIDQVIVTPDGEQPPKLTDPNFRSLGIQRAKERDFGEKVSAMEFKPGATYTFSFWSIARFIDTSLWEMRGIIPGVKLGFNNFCGKPPVHMVFYSLDNAALADKRHLDSRKQYAVRLAFWSTVCKPPASRLHELLEGLGEEEAGAVASHRPSAGAAQHGSACGADRRVTFAAESAPAGQEFRGRRRFAKGFPHLGGCMDGLSLLRPSKPSSRALRG